MQFTQFEPQLSGHVPHHTCSSRHYHRTTTTATTHFLRISHLARAETAKTVLGSDLVAALAGLDVDEFTHLEGVVVGCGGDCSFAKLQVLMLVVMVLEVGAASLAYNCPGCYRGSKKSKSFCRAVAQSTYIYVHNLHVLYAVFVFAFFLHLT